MQNFSVLIVTDEPEFARLLTACWRAERDVPAITVLAVIVVITELILNRLAPVRPPNTSGRHP